MGAARSAAFCFAVSSGGFAESRRNLTIPVCFDFILISLSSRDHADFVFTQGINNYDFRTIDKANGYEAALAVIAAVIQSFDAIVIEEYPCSKWERIPCFLKLETAFLVSHSNFTIHCTTFVVTSRNLVVDV